MTSFKGMQYRWNYYKRITGNFFVGEWFCYNCKFMIFPNPLQTCLEIGVIKMTNDKFVCPKCKEILAYDEAM